MAIRSTIARLAAIGLGCVSLGGCWAHPFFSAARTNFNVLETGLSPGTVTNSTLAWSTTFAGPLVSPVSFSDTIYTALDASGPASEDRVFALGAELGEPRWSASLADETVNSVDVVYLAMYGGDLWVFWNVGGQEASGLDILDRGTGEVVGGGRFDGRLASISLTRGRLHMIVTGGSFVDSSFFAVFQSIPIEPGHTDPWYSILATGQSLPPSTRITVAGDAVIAVAGTLARAFWVEGCGDDACGPSWQRTGTSSIANVIGAGGSLLLIRSDRSVERIDTFAGATVNTFSYSTSSGGFAYDSGMLYVAESPRINGYPINCTAMPCTPTLSIDVGRPISTLTGSPGLLYTVGGPFGDNDLLAYAMTSCSPCAPAWQDEGTVADILIPTDGRIVASSQATLSVFGPPGE